MSNYNLFKKTFLLFKISYISICSKTFLIQVKRHTKINKYHLKVLQETYSKNTREGATQKQSTSKQKKERNKTVSNVFRDSPHPDPASCDNQSVEF